MGPLTDRERQISKNATGPRFKISVGALDLKLTLKEIDQTLTEIKSFQMQRARIQNSPEKYDSSLHSDLFTEEEKINLSQNRR